MVMQNNTTTKPLKKTNNDNENIRILKYIYV